MMDRAGVESGFGFKAHPHMFRHACGYALADEGPRHTRAASLPGPQEHPTHGAVHGAVACALQGFLAQLARKRAAFMHLSSYQQDAAMGAADRLYVIMERRRGLGSAA